MTAALSSAEISDAMLSGVPVFGEGNRQVGSVAQVIGFGEDALLRIELGGMFCINGRLVAQPAAALCFLREANGSVVVQSDLSPEAFEQLPEAAPA